MRHNPTAEWTGRQIVEAFPWDTAPKYMHRDRDSIFGLIFQNQVKNLEINEVISAPQSPWQNPYVERFIGSVRRECLDHSIVFSLNGLKRLLKAYISHIENVKLLICFLHFFLQLAFMSRKLILVPPINAIL